MKNKGRYLSDEKRDMLKEMCWKLNHISDRVDNIAAEIEIISEDLLSILQSKGDDEDE